RCVQDIQQLKQLFLRRVRGKDVILGVDAQSLARPALGVDIDDGSRIVADAHQTETGLDSALGKFFDSRFRLRMDQLGDCFAVDELGRHVLAWLHCYISCMGYMSAIAFNVTM